MILRYEHEASDWKAGLLIGNGRLHGTVWEDGQTHSDRISFNHEHLWSGQYGKRKTKKRDHFLPYVRQFLKEGDDYRATVLASMAFGGDGGISPYPRQEDRYLAAGDLVFQYQGKEETGTRSLDLDRGLAEAGHQGVACHAFADCISQWICVRWSSRELISGVLAFEYESYGEDDRQEITAADGRCEMKYRIVVDEECRYAVEIHIQSDGVLERREEGVSVTNASYIEGYINIGVSYEGLDKELERYPAPEGSWDAILEKHSRRFQGEMEKSMIHLTDEYTESLQNDTINQRLERMRAGGRDAELMSLYVQFGKYLFLSGSICGKLPLNLQGKWNCDPAAPWNCDYHFNINIQMNYWFAEQTGLADYTAPLFDYVNRFAENGKEAARRLYGCRGTWLSLNGDHWAVSTPEAYNYAAWIGGGAWMAQHYWWHYRYGGDLEFLENNAYPFFQAVAEFYEDYIQLDDEGKAWIAPSQSPENCFKGTGDFPVSFCSSSAMDVQLVYDAFTYAIESSRILGRDERQRERWESLRSKLPEFRIGSDGRLLEWEKEREEVEKGHRHYSHLYGLFPSNLFHRQSRRAPYEAAGKSLDYRLMHAGGGTGWSRAWAACLYARLLEGDKAYEQMSCLLTDLSSPTLLDLHPKPPRCRVKNPETGYVFQIDGNMGASRAVLECLVQSYDGRVYLLPALPKAWKTGSVSGIRVEGGHEISLSFRDGELTSLEAVIGFEQRLLLDNSDGWLGEEKELELCGEPGERVIVLEKENKSETNQI